MTPTEARQQTKDHIERVGGLLRKVMHSLGNRAQGHDAGKLEEPEAPIFEANTAKLSGLTYNTPEYKEALAAMKVAIDHHYAENRHHPEHFEDGIAGMDLIDLVEMFCDWRAASERHPTGDIFKSIKSNIERFNLDPQLTSILLNTATRMKEEGW